MPVVWERAVACLVGVQPPVLQLLLEERAAHVRGIVQLSCPVVVQDLSEHARMPATKKHTYPLLCHPLKGRLSISFFYSRVDLTFLRAIINTSASTAHQSSGVSEDAGIVPRTVATFGIGSQTL